MDLDELIEALKTEGIEATVVEPTPSRMGDSRLLPLSRIRGCLHVTKVRHSWKTLRGSKGVPGARQKVYDAIKGDLRFTFRRRRSLGP